jgi:hypothetical protein
LQEAIHGVEQGVMLKMVRPDEMGGMIQDIKGKQLFNGKFLPMFNSAFNEWVKAGKDPYAFLMDQDKIDKMMEVAYPKRQRDSDNVFAQHQGEKSNESLPKTPANINPSGWVSLVSAPPVVNGVSYPVTNWGLMLQKLHDNPTDENKAAFNERFGAAGLTADDALAKLKMAERQPSPLTAAAQELAHRIGLDRH